MISEVVLLHGVPSPTVTDRDARITDKVWQFICKRLPVQVVETAYHLYTGGHPEGTGRIRGKMMVHCIPAVDTKCDEALPVFRQTYKASARMSTKGATFLAWLSKANLSVRNRALGLMLLLEYCLGGLGCSRRRQDARFGARGSTTKLRRQEARPADSRRGQICLGTSRTHTEGVAKVFKDTYVGLRGRRDGR